ncbi:MAG: NAD(P)H-dependent flavin oxidoreductase [Pikeienuella sp.]
MITPLTRTANFCESYGLRAPILMAPMAGACPPELAIAVANGGGLGGCGALLMKPEAIRTWANDVRAKTNGAFQLNLWIPDPAPERNHTHEAQVRAFLSQHGPEVAPDAGDTTPIDFAAQCEAVIDAGPAIVSSIMGVYPPEIVERFKERGIKWFATVTTVAEAKESIAAGADVIIAQGAEAGGHRGSFDPDRAATDTFGLFAILPAIVDAVGDTPVVATGGIGDARGIAAALMLGASAVQIGTSLLRTPEAGIASAWADAIATTLPEDTTVTRAFSGRLGRSIATEYVKAAGAADAPNPAPYPVQSGLTAAMRAEAAKAGDLSHMQVWAGQSARLATTEPAADLVRRLWDETQAMLTAC